MSRALRAEVLKLRSTRLLVGLSAGALALVLLGVALTLGFEGQQGTPELTGEEGVRSVLSQVGGGWIFTLILGVLGMTGELRHGTLTPTFLATPRRGRVLAAKLAVYAGVGVVVTALCALAVLAVGLPWLAAKDISVDLGSSTVP